MALGFLYGSGGSAKRKYIYKDGILYSGIDAYATKPSFTSAGTVNGTIVNANNLLTISQDSGSYGFTSFVTDEIDVTNINSFTITINSTNNSINAMYFALSQSLANGYVATNLSRAYNAGEQVGIHTVDCSQLTGKYRLVIMFSTANNNVKSANISEIAIN